MAASFAALRRSPSPSKAVAVVTVGTAVVALFIVMRPDLMLAANTPTGGDMGAHVFLPAFVRDTLLPQGRVLGWSNDWYAGFPALYFYFPLPILTIVLLDFVLPYGVAFKLVASAGIVTLPLASYYLARSMGFTRAVATVAGVAGGTYVFMESHNIFGANVKATMAGEFTFSPLAGLLLALTALSHIIVALVVVIVSLPLLLRRRGPATVIGSWLLGFAIAGFWAAPLMTRIFSFTTDMGWSPVKGFDKIFPGEFLPIVVLGLGGLGWSWWRGRDVVAATWLAILPVAGYLLLPVLGVTKLYNARLLPFWYYTMYLFAGVAVGLAVSTLARRSGRVYLTVVGAAWMGLHAVVAVLLVRDDHLSTPWAGAYLFIAAAVGVVVLAWLRRLSGRQAILAAGVGLTSFFFLAAGLLGIAEIVGWVRWNYTGYEGKEPWLEYKALMETVDDLPEGRILWEANKDMGRYGTPMSLMLFPYWTEGTHASMEGLYFESSITTPFHFLNAAEVSQAPSNPVGSDAIEPARYHNLDFDRALKHLPVYNIRYYISFTEEARAEAVDRGLPVVAESQPWTVFELPESSLVEVATTVPAVYEGSDFYRASLAWYERVDELDHWLVADGPDDWPRTANAEASLVGLGRPIAAAGTVSDVVMEESRITFRTTAVGVPHLVKVSHFPNWTARGAEGPYRAAPSLMVVIPTEEEVEIVFERTWDEILGMALTGVGIALLVIYPVLYRRFRRPGRFAA